jgi:molybdate transport system substrate-binding protein
MQLKPRIYFSLFFWLATSTQANEVQVAVAANFAAPMKQIAAAFQQMTGHQIALSFGATPKFYAQINNGAPFDILLAADQTTPTQLAQQKIAIASSQFTYAIGKLVLWSTTKQTLNETVLKQGKFSHLALAAPQAPYGIAARQTLASLHLLDKLASKLVQGESVGQTYSFVASGNAELGFVALSQVWKNHQLKFGSVWLVPGNLYTPLHQDAILLQHGATNSAAHALLAYLKSDEAKNVIRSYGYEFKF